MVKVFFPRETTYFLVFLLSYIYLLIFLFIFYFIFFLFFLGGGGGMGLGGWQYYGKTYERIFIKFSQ